MDIDQAFVIFIKTISFTNYLQLRELQPGYTDLYQSVNQYLFFEEKKFITKKVEQLQSQVLYRWVRDDIFYLTGMEGLTSILLGNVRGFIFKISATN